MTDPKTDTVHAQWDDQTKTWTTNGEDIPGLVCETTNLETLVEVVSDVAPDLLHSNIGIPSGTPIDIIIITERQIRCIAAGFPKHF